MGSTEPPHHGFDRRALQRNLRQGMHHPEDDSKAFIEYSQLQVIWNNVDLHCLFPRDEWSDKHIDIIRGQYLKLLSTLIVISWPGVCHQRNAGAFRVFLDDHADICKDDNMPVADGQFPFLEGTKVPQLPSIFPG